MQLRNRVVRCSWSGSSRRSGCLSRLRRLVTLTTPAVHDGHVLLGHVYRAGTHDQPDHGQRAAECGIADHEGLRRLDGADWRIAAVDSLNIAATSATNSSYQGGLQPLVDRWCLHRHGERDAAIVLSLIEHLLELQLVISTVQVGIVIWAWTHPRAPQGPIR
jgi:hypothetical protein